MSNTPQCPSTVGKEPAETSARELAAVSGSTGQAYWRSLDELADTPEFRERLEREFPAFASELDGGSRRTFMKLMGASLALAGAATLPGCRRPDHKILAYTTDPEHVIPGQPLYVATAMPLPGGGAEGLLAETHTGRPTKLEGNPLHPVNMGTSTVRSQASVLNLYDPDRSKAITRLDGDERALSDWAEFDAFARGHFARFDRTGGEGLFFLVDKRTSPSRDSIRAAMLNRWPQARWLPYEPADDESGLAGSRIAFGQPMRETRRLENAKVILSICDDFLGSGASPDEIRGYADSRRITATRGEGGQMSRLYALESSLTATGAQADHRLRLKPSLAAHAAAQICERVLRKMPGAGGGARQLWDQLESSFGRLNGSFAYEGASVGHGKSADDWMDAVADDLVRRRGDGAVILAGPQLPAAVRALVCVVNEALGAYRGVLETRPASGDASESSLGSISLLSQAINSGQVDTLVTVGCNPVYDAPADLGFPAAHASVSTTIHLGETRSETGAVSTWEVPRAHYLETWGDASTNAGVLSVCQPMIAPIFDGRSDIEFVERLLGGERDGYAIVRDAWRAVLGADGFQTEWERTLHDGFRAAPRPTAAATTSAGRVVNAFIDWIESAPVDTEGVEAVFAPCPKLHDGRWANNGWLQELPDTITKITWDNPAFVSPATAEKLGIRNGQKSLGKHSGQMIRVTINGRSVELPAWIVPGVAEDTVVLTLGYGRWNAGRVGDGVGFDVYPVRSAGALAYAAAEVEPQRGSEMIACTQDHWSLEGRVVYREVDRDAWAEFGDSPEELFKEKDAYGRKRDLTFAQALGMESKVPVNKSAYRERQLIDYSEGPQWGMSIDLNACTGCNACVVACQSENNIPVIGKREVAKGREMHWIRIDRYFGDARDSGEVPSDKKDTWQGPGEGDVTVAIQPVTCMHCENAPCETVCPVNATAHGPDGLNHMAYNRCIGTRYCANNCPYKVRRFNFFDYATKRLNGDYVGKDVVSGVIKNEALIPPRLRERIEEGDGEVQTMQFNPDVTVRSRGVMEKCTYCVQRINASRSDAKADGRWASAANGTQADGSPVMMPDGAVKAACQQACPAKAISFGDILDPGSQVAIDKDSGRTYAMLDYLNIKPRTTYMIRLRNPNPELRPHNLEFVEELRDKVKKAKEMHGGHGDDHGDDHHDDGHVMSLPVMNGGHA